MDRFENPTALSWPFWYDHSKGHLGEGKLKPSAKNDIERLRGEWLKKVKDDLTRLFEEHDFAYVVLQSGADSIVGGDGDGKLGLIIRPFLSFDNHNDLAAHVTRLSARGGSKLLVLGGGGYNVGKAADQWTAEFKTITETFRAEQRERTGSSKKNKSMDLSEKKWQENAAHQL